MRHLERVVLRELKMSAPLVCCCRQAERFHVIVEPDRPQPFNHFGTAMSETFQLDVGVVDFVLHQSRVEIPHCWKVAAVLRSAGDQNSPGSSSPARVERDSRMVCDMLRARKRTEPSAIRKWAPPSCQLQKLEMLIAFDGAF